MKRAFIFGEFIAKSTTGIAYVNTNLEALNVASVNNLFSTTFIVT